MIFFLSASNFKASCRTKWASVAPPLAVSTAWHRIVLEAVTPWPIWKNRNFILTKKKEIKTKGKKRGTALSLKNRFGYSRQSVVILSRCRLKLFSNHRRGRALRHATPRRADFPSPGSCISIHFQRGSDLQPRSVMCQAVLKLTEDSRRPTCCEKRLPALRIQPVFQVPVSSGHGLCSSNFTFIWLQIPADNYK